MTSPHPGNPAATGPLLDRLDSRTHTLTEQATRLRDDVAELRRLLTVAASATPDAFIPIPAPEQTVLQQTGVHRTAPQQTGLRQTESHRAVPHPTAAQPAEPIPPGTTPPDPVPPVAAAAPHRGAPFPGIPAPGSTGPFAGTPPFTPPAPPAGFPSAPRPPAPDMPPRPLTERLAAAAERGTVGRVLAALGVGITLIGVTLLLVLAAQAGLLRPELRVAGGALLAAALVGAGLRVGRRAERRSGAAGLVATGIAAGYLTVLAATVLYDWLPSIAGLVLTGAVAAAGLVVAHRWNGQALSLLIVLPLLVLGPVITGGATLELLVAMLILAAATCWLHLGRDWLGLFAARTAATTLPLLFVTVFPAGADYTDAGGLLALAVAAAALALGLSLPLLRWTDRGLSLTLIAMTSLLPLLIGATAVPTGWQAGVLAVTAGLLAAASLTGHRLPGATDAVRHTWLAAASLTLFWLCVDVFGEVSLVIALLGVAVVCATGARFAGRSALPVTIVATGFGSIGALAYLVLLPGFLDEVGMIADNGVDVLATSLLLVVAAVALAAAWLPQLPTDRAVPVVIVAGLTALVGISQFCVSAGLLIDDSHAGFLGGQLAATLVWTAAGALALHHARSGERDRGPALGVGLALIAAATAKLFVYDLATLSGIYRVSAFIIVGLVLLGLGVTYARTLTTGRAGDQSESKS